MSIRRPLPAPAAPRDPGRRSLFRRVFRLITKQSVSPIQDVCDGEWLTNDFVNARFLVILGRDHLGIAGGDDHRQLWSKLFHPACDV